MYTIPPLSAFHLLSLITSVTVTHCDCCLWLLMNGLGRLACVFLDRDVSTFEWMPALARKFYHSIQWKTWNLEGAVAHCHLQAAKTRGVAKGHVSHAEAQTVE